MNQVDRDRFTLLTRASSLSSFLSWFYLDGLNTWNVIHSYFLIQYPEIIFSVNSGYLQIFSIK